MKKLFVVLLLIASAPAFAYKAGDKRLSLFGGAGIAIASMSCVSGADYGNFLGSCGYSGMDEKSFNDWEDGDAYAYSFGIGLDWFLGNSIALYVGLSYDKTPVDIKFPRRVADSDHTYKFDLSYRTAAAGVHYYGKFLVAGIGGYYDDLLKGKLIFDGGSGKQEIPGVKFSDDVGVFVDLGLHFGLSEKFDLAFLLRTKFGSKTIYDYPDDDVITNMSDLASAFFSVSLGYTL